MKGKSKATTTPSLATTVEEFTKAMPGTADDVVRDLDAVIVKLARLRDFAALAPAEGDLLKIYEDANDAITKELIRSHENPKRAAGLPRNRCDDDIALVNRTAMAILERKAIRATVKRVKEALPTPPLSDTEQAAELEAAARAELRRLALNPKLLKGSIRYIRRLVACVPGAIERMQSEEAQAALVVLLASAKTKPGPVRKKETRDKNYEEAVDDWLSFVVGRRTNRPARQKAEKRRRG